MSDLIEAREIIAKAHAAHGSCTLSCDCGAYQVFITADSIDADGDAERVDALATHARYDHVGARSIIATVYAMVVDFHAEARA